MIIVNVKFTKVFGNEIKFNKLHGEFRELD